MVSHPPDAAPLNGIPRSTIHELRTPLTAIRGYAQLLQRGVRSPEQTERAYATIFRESERLAGMLDRLARVAETMLGSEDAQPVRLDLGRQAARAVDEARQRWPEHVFVYEAREEIEIVVDPRDLAEALGILLDNAALYSAPGSTVEVSVGSHDRESCLAIRDTGIGIPPDEREAVFLCFERASNVAQAGPAASRGLGIGLFLARAMATQAGGRLWAESELGLGSTFTLALPLA
jgi:signal transduction histidine kinase